MRALWQVEIDTARNYLRMLALMHADLPHWSAFTHKGRLIAEFRRSDDGSEPLDIG
ncbi:hypothetical protein [Nonomuraea dietziae]|uniref:hypothetical protein n=1 Tax=Nonomuraea dietziae TaxID=65515 RepID=UPI0033F4C282